MSQSMRTRKEQIEQDFLRRLRRQLKKAGIDLDEQSTEHVREALKSSALVGACEERSRTLSMLGPDEAHLRAAIIKQGVLDVLGYTDEIKRSKRKTTNGTTNDPKVQRRPRALHQ